MGKRRIKKHKIKSNVNKDENTSSDKLNEEDDDNQIKIDLTSMLDIINKNNSFELLKLSSFLSNYNYEILSREQDKKEKEIICFNFFKFFTSIFK